MQSSLLDGIIHISNLNSIGDKHLEHESIGKSSWARRLHFAAWGESILARSPLGLTA